MSKKTVYAFAVLFGLTAAHAVAAQEAKYIVGPTLFEECANAAIGAQKAGTADARNIETCTIAIDHSWATLSERALAYLDRGSIYQARGETELAVGDFNRAIQANPSLAAAYNDRGVAYSALHRPADAVRDFTQALALHAEDADQVLFNRALAYEDLGDSKNAYIDYRAAADKNPSWDLPAKQLARFSVGH